MLQYSDSPWFRCERVERIKSLNSIDACRAATGRRGEGVNLDNLSRNAEADNVRVDAVNG
jgi:hypothetical protein